MTGWLRNLTDPKGGVLSMNYWGPGQLRWVKNQLNQNSRDYHYDAAGRLASQTDASGGCVTNSYDAAGRLVGQWFSDNLRTTLGYDAVGRRTTMVDNSGTTTCAYDALGRLVGTTQGGVEQRYQYDAVGNRTTQVLVGTGTFLYDYDEVNRLKTMVTPAGERYTQMYDADSRRTTLLLGLGSKRKYQYDSVGRLTTQVEYNASNQGIYTMVDSYDAVGSRVKRVANGNPTTWLYDDAYRLIGQQKSGQTATFSYDANSNLTTKWPQGGNPQTMQYDAADRLTTMQVGGTTTTFQWGMRGVMARQYQAGTPVGTYSYTDINNNLRVAQDAAGLTTSTLYAPIRPHGV